MESGEGSEWREGGWGEGEKVDVCGWVCCEMMEVGNNRVDVGMLMLRIEDVGVVEK